MDGGGRLLRLGTLGDGKRAWGLCGGQMVQAFMPSHLRGGLAMGAVGWVRWEDVRDGRTRTLERDYVDVLGGLRRRGARRANRLDGFCKLRVRLQSRPARVCRGQKRVAFVADCVFFPCCAAHCKPRQVEDSHPGSQSPRHIPLSLLPLASLPLLYLPNATLRRAIT